MSQSFIYMYTNEQFGFVSLYKNRILLYVLLCKLFFCLTLCIDHISSLVPTDLSCFFNYSTASNSRMYRHLLSYFPTDLSLFSNYKQYFNEYLNCFGKHKQLFLLAKYIKVKLWAKDCTNIKFWKIVPNSVKKARMFKKLPGI